MTRHFILIIFLCYGIFATCQTKFQETIGTSNWSEAIGVICQEPNGDYFLSGTSRTSTACNIVLMKTDQNGSPLWIKNYAGSIWASGGFLKTNDGGFIYKGTFTREGGDFQDFLLLKTDIDGNLLWSKVLTGNSGREEVSTKLILMPDGGFIIVGYVKFDSFGLYDLIVIKTDSNGNILWQKLFGSPTMDTAADLIPTSDGGFMISGTCADNDGDIFLMKISNSGDILWAKNYGGSSVDYGGQVFQTADKGFVMYGTTRSYSNWWDNYLIKTDSIGDLKWAKVYGSAPYEETAGNFKPTPDKGYILTGNTGSIGNNLGDAVLIKTDSLGNVVWNMSYFNRQRNSVGRVILTNDGGYAISGSTGNDTEESDGYFIKTNSVGLSGCNESDSIIESNNFYPLSNVKTFTSIPWNFIALTQSFTTIQGGTVTSLCLSININENKLNTKNVSVSPNPSDGKFQINNLKSGDKIMVFNVAGIVIFETQSQNQMETINLNEIAKGLYIIKTKRGLVDVAIIKLIIE